MKLKSFIEELIKISEDHGDSLDVVMADNILVVNPIFVNRKVVITDINK